MAYLNYFTLNPILLLFYVLILGISIIEVNSFIPVGRAHHSSVIVDDKIYMFGGVISNGPDDLNETIYLDVSQSFNTEYPSWALSTAMPFGTAFGTVSFVDNSNSTIYLFGGTMFDPVTYEESYESFIYTFNLLYLEWEIPITEGPMPTRLQQIQAVNDDFGRIYIFGGLNNAERTLSEEMIIFDTNNLTWSYGNKLTMPMARHFYTATLLPNDIIIYIGGLYYGKKAMDIRDIVLYDTISDTWETMVHIHNIHNEILLFIVNALNHQTKKPIIF